jgi:formylglycine-generating enzyme required for sulfatase activity
VTGQALDDPAATRQAGRDLLSLALLDARNHLLRGLAALAPAADPPADPPADALRAALHAGWYQEYWIARHVQRQRGEACDPAGPRLGGIEPRIAVWLAPPGESDALRVPGADAVRAYLAQTLELTLDLLAGTPDDDAPLHFYRQALLHEDRLGEALAVLLQRAAPPARAQRPPLWLPAQRWMLGSAPAAAEAPGWVPHNERWAHAVALPEFEIDAQAVNWSQFAEFASDGGYDRGELWTDAGWTWLQAGSEGSRDPRRGPRHVAQLAGGVLVHRGGAGLQRAAAGQAAMHVSRFEAEAWCRWAGRRLPAEPEWELAAATAASRGFVWGDVFEWVAGSARSYPACGPSAPGCLDVLPAPRDGASAGVLRGASFATRPRRHHPRARRFAWPDFDAGFVGFRSCAV